MTNDMTYLLVPMSKLSIDEVDYSAQKTNDITEVYIPRSKDPVPTSTPMPSALDVPTSEVTPVIGESTSNLDHPIAVIIGTCSCTAHLIPKFVSYSAISPSFYACKSLQDAMSHPG